MHRLLISEQSSSASCFGRRRSRLPGLRDRSCCIGHPREEGFCRARVKEGESPGRSTWRVRNSGVRTLHRSKIPSGCEDV